MTEKYEAKALSSISVTKRWPLSDALDRVFVQLQSQQPEIVGHLTLGYAIGQRLAEAADCKAAEIVAAGHFVLVHSALL